MDKKRIGLDAGGLDSRFQGNPSSRKWLFASVIFSAAILFLKLFCLDIYVVPNQSMTPFLKENQIFILDKISLHLNKVPQRNDVVVFKFPNQTRKDVKRIIGVPGDEIRFQQGHVWINGKRDDKICTSSQNFGRTFFEDRRFQIPEGAYFVLGDQCDASLDSRDWGYVPAENIFGYFMTSFL